MGDLATLTAAAATLSALTMIRPRVALYITIAAVGVQPLFVPVAGFFVSPVDVAVAAGAAGLAGRLLRGDGDASRAIRQHGWVGAMLLAYVVGGLVVGHLPRTLIRVALALIPSILACELLTERAHLRSAAMALVIAGVLDVVMTLGFAAIETTFHPTRFSGFGGPNFSALIIVPAAAIAIMQLARTAKPWRLVMPAALAGFALATLSMMGALALLIASALVAPVMTKRNRTLLAAAAVLMISVAVSQSSIRQALWVRTQPAMQNDGVPRTSSDLRWAMIEAALRGFREHPVVGLGFGRFQAFSLTNREIRAATAGIGFGTHNTYLEVLSEGGLLAFIPFVLHLLRYRTAVAAARSTWRHRDIDVLSTLVGLPMMLVCAALANLLLLYVFWAVNGLALAGLAVHRTRAATVTPAAAGAL